MKRLVLSMLLILTLSACAGQAQATEQSFVPIGGLRPTPTPQPELMPAEQAAVEHLASTLDIPVDEIRVVSTEAVEWPDGCLGIQHPGMQCTQAIVPGYRIMLEAKGEQFEMRTNESGSQVAQASGAPLGLMEEAIIAQLASNLRLEPDKISIVSSSDVEFPDSCLGVAVMEEVCAQTIVPGKIIALEANDLQFEYHISADGSRVQPATLAFMWKREGGIAGFCNGMTVFLSGEVYAMDCKSQPTGAMQVFADLVSPAAQEEFFQWIAKSGEHSLDESDPEGVSDRMVVTIDFYGTGSGKLSEAERQELFQFAQDLYQKLGQ